MPKDHNTEGTQNYPDLPQRSEVEIVVIEETETSPTKSLAVLQVRGGKETMVEERGNVNKECLIVGSQECLLSSSDKGSEGLEKFLRDKLESFGGDAEGKFFTDPGSISSCMELLETFSDSALQCGYNPWESVDINGYKKIRAELEKSYKAVRVASDVESSSSLSEPVFVSERLPEQRRCPAQRPCIDNIKTHHRGVAELLAGKLQSKHKTSKAESS